MCPNDSVCNGHYSQIPATGGVCGYRAFFSRFARKAFGLPTWGVTEKGHAAMSSWNPEAGWHTQLGAGWQYGWWGQRSGPDFYLEATAREGRAAFQAVLRGGWVAKARGEAPVSPDWTPTNAKSYGKGGAWGALMLYAKKIAVNATSPLPPRPIGPSVVPTKVAALIAAWGQKWPKPAVTTDGNGTIIIPSAALDFVNRSAPVGVMKSFDLQGEQVLLLDGNYVDRAFNAQIATRPPRNCDPNDPNTQPCARTHDPNPTASASAFGYDIDVPAPAGTRYLTANISTWHTNIDLLLRVNNASDDDLLTVPVFYTVGRWQQTQAVAVPLVAGVNTLRFMRTTELVQPLAVKEFFIYLEQPDIPAPPSNFTPTPPAPRPSRFIEVPAATTCAKQGITDVPVQFCSEACQALGLKYAGGKPHVNMTGCFVIDAAAPVCTYNTNASATVCPEQPCTVGGSVAQQLCLRQ